MPTPGHWSATDWLTAIGVLAAWTTLFGAAIGFTLRFVVRAVFQDKLEPTHQELRVLSAAVSRLDTSTQGLDKYCHERFHDIAEIVQRNELSIAVLQGDIREMTATLKHVEKATDKIEQTVDRIALGRAGG